MSYTQSRYASPCPYVSRDPIQTVTSKSASGRERQRVPSRKRKKKRLRTVVKRSMVRSESDASALASSGAATPSGAGESVKKKKVGYLPSTPSPSPPWQAESRPCGLRQCAPSFYHAHQPHGTRHSPGPLRCAPGTYRSPRGPQPAPAHMHGVVSCAHAAVQFLTSSLSLFSHPFQNLKWFPP